MKNIVLIGMPGSGKSSLGRRLARRLRMPLFDTDAMVVERDGRAISDIFAEGGEAAFRDMESACVREAAAQSGVVISTGGGVILRGENMDALKKNGMVFFIDRHPSLILKSASLSDRPLVQDDRTRLLELYRSRIALYRACADVTIRNDRRMSKRLRRGVLQILRHYRRAAR